MPNEEPDMDKFFDIEQNQLLDVATHLKKKILEGLAQPGQEIESIPTYIPVQKGPQNGRALVIDFGGTNVRAAVVSLNNGDLILEKGPAKMAIPIERGVPLARDKFLQSISDLVVSIHPPQDLPLGYCFSYPIDSLTDGDARLIKWTKEVFVNDTIGEKVGQLLLDALASHVSPVRCTKVAVLNDTVASLLAGLTALQADGYIGLIVGTGNNMAVLMDGKQIKKLPQELDWDGLLPINLESGNFTPPHLTTFDDWLDQRSEFPNHSRLEKAVSGVYLAKLLKLAYPASDVDVSIGSKAVVEKAYAANPSDQEEQDVARQILTRSAKLVAASLAGLISVLNDAHVQRHVCIAAEGGLFWGDPNYKQTTHNTLGTLLGELGISDVTVDFFSLPNANLLGSAVAALSS
ncbi:hexokinase [candidate division KSB3 bacterium]|uniref:Hexokinase n=1 Tax=candidate division KSB3 bacterium TaxID=2044937 RepID=A0A2G6KH95_9BACT|nr:MAG: hexokinase [candidate division KSB3 bacterium]